MIRHDMYLPVLVEPVVNMHAPLQDHLECLQFSFISKVYLVFCQFLCIHNCDYILQFYLRE